MEANAAVHRDPLEAQPVPALALASREQLRASLKPEMTKATFACWLWRARKDHGFPEPIRLGARGVAWSIASVSEWLASRPRGGSFAGRRHQEARP